MTKDRFWRWLHLGGDFFEEIIAAIYRARVRPGDLVLDVGANHGRHTFPLAACVGARGRVIAIEALPHLAANLAEATRGLRQVRVLAKAMADETGETAFVWVKKDEGFSGLRERRMPPELAEEVVSLRVKTSTIDRAGRQLWPFRRPLSFIKMDVEGGEYHALRGAKRLVLAERPMIVFENGGPAAAQSYGYSEDQFFDLFEDLRCDIFDLFGRPLTREIWHAETTPWYAIAVARGTRDVAFVREEVPALIEKVEQRFETAPEQSALVQGASVAR